MAPRLAITATLALSLTGLSGCSATDGCESTLSCNGGESEETETLGEVAARDCEVDADCEDGQACTIDTCQEGHCRVESACSNPDEKNCIMACTEDGGVPHCTLSARDEDGDGVGSDQCKPAPGTDCDDTRSDVYPFAPELCDGRDNDCNEAVDLNDSLPLSGQDLAFTEVALSLTALSEKTADGFAVLRQTNAGLTLSLVKDDLKGVSSSYQATSSSVPSGDYTIAHEQGVYATAWSVAGNLELRLFETSGPTTGILPMTNAASRTDRNPRLAATSLDEWALAWSVAETDEALGLRLHRGGAVLGSAVPLGEGAPAGFGSAHGEIAALLNLDELTWHRRSEDLSSLQAPTVLSSMATSAAMGVGSDRYLVAWNTASGFYARAFSDVGATLCGPVAVPLSGELTPVSVVESPAGFVVGGSSNGVAALAVIGPDCAPRSKVEPLTDKAVTGPAYLATSKDGVVAFWADGTIHYRRFGPLLCD